MLNYIIPLFVIFLIAYSTLKKVDCYASFVDGATKGIELVYSIAPYICAVLMLVILCKTSGFSSFITNLVAPIFNFFGIPSELAEFVLIRPFTGSGSLAMLENICTRYGADSYIANCASVIMGSGETVFYVSALYFSVTKSKKVGVSLIISLFVSFVACVISCLLCKIML